MRLPLFQLLPGGVRPLTAAMVAAWVTATSHAAVIIDQIGDPNSYPLTFVPGASASQVFLDDPTYTCFTADDFTVTAETNLTSVAALVRAKGGFDKFAAVPSWRVNVYSSAAAIAASNFGDAGTRSLGGAAVFIERVGASDLAVIELNLGMLAVAPGTYWVSVAPEAALATEDQFFTFNNVPGSPGGLNAQWANPGGGFAIAPITMPLNFAYRVVGVPVPESSALWLPGGIALLVGIRRRR